MTWEPAPMANNISVAVADRETIFVGLGAADDDALVAAGLESLPQAAASATARQRARSRLRKGSPPLFESGDLDGRRTPVARTALFLESCCRAPLARRSGSSSEEASQLR